MFVPRITLAVPLSKEGSPNGVQIVLFDTFIVPEPVVRLRDPAAEAPLVFKLFAVTFAVFVIPITLTASAFAP